jgi:hypothetical protein
VVHEWLAIGAKHLPPAHRATVRGRIAAEIAKVEAALERDSALHHWRALRIWRSRTETDLAGMPSDGDSAHLGLADGTRIVG